MSWDDKLRTSDRAIMKVLSSPTFIVIIFIGMLLFKIVTRH